MISDQRAGIPKSTLSAMNGLMHCNTMRHAAGFVTREPIACDVARHVSEIWSAQSAPEKKCQPVSLVAGAKSGSADMGSVHGVGRSEWVWRTL